MTEFPSKSFCGLPTSPLAGQLIDEQAGRQTPFL
jgi:hypothetical protein